MRNVMVVCAVAATMPAAQAQAAWPVSAGGWIRCAAAGDINEDQRDEIIIGSDASFVNALNEWGNVVWEFKTGWQVQQIAIADVLGNDRPEVIVGGGDGKVYALDSQGRAIWERDLQWQVTHLAVGDVSGDGRPEIAAASNDGTVRLFSGEGKVAWQQSSKHWVGGLALMPGSPGLTVVAREDDSLEAYDSSGKSAWRIRTGLGLPWALTVVDHAAAARVALGADKGLGVFDAKGGKVWQASIGRVLLVRPMNLDDTAADEILASGPLAEDDPNRQKRLVGAHNAAERVLYAYDGDGKRLWQYETPAMIRSVAAFRNRDRTCVAIGSVDRRVTAIDSSGKFMFATELDGWAMALAARRRARWQSDDLVACTAGDGRTAHLIRAGRYDELGRTSREPAFPQVYVRLRNERAGTRVVYEIEASHTEPPWHGRIGTLGRRGLIAEGKKPTSEDYVGTDEWTEWADLTWHVRSSGLNNTFRFRATDRSRGRLTKFRLTAQVSCAPETRRVARTIDNVLEPSDRFILQIPRNLSPRLIRTESELFESMYDQVKGVNVAGPMPKKLWVIGQLPSEREQFADKSIEIAQKLGINMSWSERTGLQVRLRSAGFIEPPIEIVRVEQRVSSLAAEAGEFGQWLRDRGVTLQEIGASSWEAVVPVGYEQAGKSDRLWHYTRVYERDRSIWRHWQQWNRLERTGLNCAGLRAESLFLNPASSPIDWWDLSATRVLTCPDPGVYADQHLPLGHVAGTMAFACDALRSCTERDSARFIARFNASHGASAVGVRQAMYSAAAHGARILWPWAGSVLQCYTAQPQWSDRPAIAAEIAKVTHELATVEDVFVDGRREPARVAIIFANSTDQRHFDKSAHALERYGLSLAMMHSQIPSDVITTGQVTAGALLAGQYRVTLLTGDHIRPDAAQKIKQWVRRGGVLIATGGGGLRDQFDRPLPTLAEVYGVEDVGTTFQPGLPRVGPFRALMRDNWPLRLVWAADVETPASAGQALPAAAPITTLRWQGWEDKDLADWRGNDVIETALPSKLFERISFPVIAFKHAFKLRTATALGSYTDKSPAVALHEFGQGKAVLIGGLPGLAYLQAGAARRQMRYPTWRGKDVCEAGLAGTPWSEHVKPATGPRTYPDELREFIASGVGLAEGLTRKVELSKSQIDVAVYSNDRSTVLLMINHTSEAMDDVEVTVNKLPLVAHVSAASGTKVEFERAPGSVRLRLPIKQTEIVTIAHAQ